jgi:tetrapyrrole methylase family protein/MazG family protein
LTKEEILQSGLQDQEHYSFEDLRKIIRILRDPENGCPWDKVQTHDSLRECFQNEVDEVFGGMDRLDRTGDAENLCEELGDVLMHVVLQAVIAEQEGLFTMDDVIEGVSRKMIRRHPHVFTEKEASDEEGLLRSWNEIKAEEKAEKAKGKL